MHFISRLYFNSYSAGAQCALHILSYPLHEIVLICFSAFVPVVLHLCILLCTYLMFFNFDVTNISYGCALCFCGKKSRRTDHSFLSRLLSLLHFWLIYDDGDDYGDDDAGDGDGDW